MVNVNNDKGEKVDIKGEIYSLLVVFELWMKK